MTVTTARPEIPGQPTAATADDAATAVEAPSAVATATMTTAVEAPTDVATAAIETPTGVATTTVEVPIDLATATTDAASAALATVVDPGLAVEVAAVLDTAVPVAAAEAASAAGLRVLAAGEWPVGDADDLPGVAGFIVSSFNPLVVAAAGRALRTLHAEPPLPGALGADTAVIVVSAYGDAVSARAVAAAVDAGDRVGPLMFFQSVPNAVAGFVASQWGLTGPVVAISPADATAALAEGAQVARLLVADGDAARALVVAVEQGTGADGRGDSALAVLLEPVREQES